MEEVNLSICGKPFIPEQWGYVYVIHKDKRSTWGGKCYWMMRYRSRGSKGIVLKCCCGHKIYKRKGYNG